MGVDSDAILFYGYCWEDEGNPLEHHRQPPKEDREEGSIPAWEDIIACKRGHKNPWDHYPDEDRSLPYEERRRQSDAWIAAHNAEITAWTELTSAIEKEFGVDIGYHGSSEYSVPYLYVVDTRRRACLGEPKEIDPEALVAGAYEDDLLRRFANELGITLPEGGPQWWLVSYWG